MVPPRNFSLPTLALQLRVHAPQLFRNFLIIGLWLWVYRALFDYLGVIAFREDFRTNQLVLLGILGLIVWQVYTGQFRVRFHTTPRPYPLPLALTLGGTLMYLVAERVLDINTLSATLFGIATYGLVGLWMLPRSWREGLPAALLLIGVLPFGEHMQTFIGYPMRILTAELVRDGLAAFGITSAGVDTILVLENGVSQIDLPCSGVKSLWTGALFFLAVTWLERRPLNLRWLSSALIFFLLLFVANGVRVAALVVTAHVFNMPVVAEMLHVPLGVMGFVGACAAAVGLLRWRSKNVSAPSVAPWEAAPLAVPHFTLALCVILCAMGIVYTPRPETGLTQAAPVWNFPSALNTKPLPLKPDEIMWLTRDGAESATRLRFSWAAPNTGEISGSMILVPSRTWRAHHRPERCFEVFGLRLTDSRAQWVGQNFPLRAVTLADPQSGARLNAAYWFQSASRTTDDFGTRVWSDTTAPAERWVLVSILFDQPIEPNDPRVIELYQALHKSVTEQLG